MDRRIITVPLALLPLLAVQCQISELEPPEVPSLALRVSPIKMFDFSWLEAEGADTYALLEREAPGEPFMTIATELLEPDLSMEMPLHLRNEASYMLRACNLAGCTDSDPIPVMGTLARATGYFKGSRTDPGDRFGDVVAVSGDGDTLVVGVPYEDGGSTGINGNESDDSQSNAGAVYVFVHSDEGEWRQQAYVKASNARAGAYFGISIAVSHDGDTIVVGASGEDSGATGIGGDEDDESAPDSGAAYVFVRDASNRWQQQAYVKASNAQMWDYFGQEVVLSENGNTMVVAAPLEDGSVAGIDGDQYDEGAIASGAAYVFVRGPSNDWRQTAYLKASNPGSSDLFGLHMALSHDGNTLAVGAPWEDSGAMGIDGTETDDSTRNSGAVYLFDRSPTNRWSQQAYIKASNTDADDLFGSSLALDGSGDMLVVGAPAEDGNASGLDGDRTDDSFANAGAAYVLTRDSMRRWSHDTYVKASNPGPQDRFGESLTLDREGTVLVVGAPAEDGRAVGVGGNEDDDSAADAGAAYAFVRDPMDVWSQRGYVKASNTDPGDRFGTSMTLSADGMTLAVGSPSEDSGTTGVGGNQGDDLTSAAGAVYLF